MSKETTQELLERAERYGFEVFYDSGFVVVRRPETCDPERTRNMVEELGARIGDVRRLVLLRAVAARAKDFVGQEVWAEEMGIGRLTDSDNTGNLAVKPRENQNGFHSSSHYSYSAEHLLVLTDGCKASTSLEPQPPLREPRKTLFSRWS